ncbi:MAG: amidohydrolase family protein [Candidatus Cloacimonetes bacterium]|nr:amidohydrolase family protein [Candidatus Cloacimonadota bacterium]
MSEPLKLLKNATICIGFQKRPETVNILYTDKIVAISEQRIYRPDISEAIDLHQKILVPGCIDTNVHSYKGKAPGFPELIAETRAAAVGGITTFCDTPEADDTVVNSVKKLKAKLDIFADKSFIDFALWGGIRGNDIPLDKDSLANLFRAGIVGFYTSTYSENPDFLPLSYLAINDIISSFPNALLAILAEDAVVVNKRISGMNTKKRDTIEGYVHNHPAEAERLAVETILNLSPNALLHFFSLSSADTVTMLIEAKKAKRDISFDTTPHYAMLTKSDFKKFDGYLKTCPPVRNDSDRDSLADALKRGKFDWISSGHTGYPAKQFGKHTFHGIPGMQIMVPLIFSEMYFRQNLPLGLMVELTSTAAAKRLGLYPEKGSLKIGTDADFTVIDSGNTTKIDESFFISKAKMTPFNGKELSCRIDRTILRGQTLYSAEDGLVTTENIGQWVRAKH